MALGLMREGVALGLVREEVTCGLLRVIRVIESPRAGSWPTPVPTDRVICAVFQLLRPNSSRVIAQSGDKRGRE
jgi:hypothetical protein